jgi:hypothetical protein
VTEWTVTEWTESKNWTESTEAREAKCSSGTRCRKPGKANASRSFCPERPSRRPRRIFTWPPQSDQPIVIWYGQELTA